MHRRGFLDSDDVFGQLLDELGICRDGGRLDVHGAEELRLMGTKSAVKRAVTALTVTHVIHMKSYEPQDLGLAPTISETAVMYQSAHVTEQLPVGRLHPIRLMAIYQ